MTDPRIGRRVNYGQARLIAVGAYAFVLAASVAALFGLFDAGWYLVLATMGVSIVVALRWFARCRGCGKSMLVRAKPARIIGQPPTERRAWWPEDRCSRCGRRLDV